jgi:hypothetical protein
MSMSINSPMRNAPVAAAIALSGCAIDPRGGYRPATQLSGGQEQPISFDERTHAAGSCR